MVCRPGARHCYEFIVFNCLTGCVKVLPPPILSPWTLRKRFLMFSFSMTLDAQDPSCYYLLLSSCMGTYFEFFDSRSACWKAVRNRQVGFKSGQLLRDFVSAHPSSDQLSVVDADFWWLETSEDGTGEHCLLAYHARYDVWTSLLLPSIPCEKERHWPTIVVKYKGRLYLGLQLVGVDFAILGFGVWELQPATSTWVEVGRTPKHLIQPALSCLVWWSTFCADGGLFCMSFCSKKTRRCAPPLVYDMPRNAWYSLPLEKTARKFGCISLLRPSFTASP
ncbi:hypothetical protein L7F22_015182 [Adiantum nelumboides]|nr:hypothetical protein [Adiantum nelumboides]